MVTMLKGKQNEVKNLGAECVGDNFKKLFGKMV